MQKNKSAPPATAAYVCALRCWRTARENNRAVVIVTPGVLALVAPTSQWQSQYCPSQPYGAVASMRWDRLSTQHARACVMGASVPNLVSPCIARPGRRCCREWSVRESEDADKQWIRHCSCPSATGRHRHRSRIHNGPAAPVAAPITSR